MLCKWDLTPQNSASLMGSLPSLVVFEELAWSCELDRHTVPEG